MAKIFLILAFVLVLNVVMPAINHISPYTTATLVPNTSALTTATVIGAAGCTGINKTNTNANCTGSLGTSGLSSSGGGGIFGAVVNTILVFGNFFAAANFLVQLFGGVLVPGYYVYGWLVAFGASATTAGEIMLIYTTPCWIAYAYGLFYIISGRWLE